MDRLMDFTVAALARPTGANWESALLALLLAFVLGQVSAWVYMYTHAGLSYSRSFVQSLVMLSVVVCFAMMIVGINVTVAFGLIGALAVIRFRNILKDTRDTAFVFFALVVGMAAGTDHHALALLGTAVFSIVTISLYLGNFGSRFTGNGFIRFQADQGTVTSDRVQQSFRRYCRGAQLVTQRYHTTGAAELAYRLNLVDPNRADELIAELTAIAGISDITFVVQEEQAEV